MFNLGQDYNNHSLKNSQVFSRDSPVPLGQRACVSYSARSYLIDTAFVFTSFQVLPCIKELSSVSSFFYSEVGDVGVCGGRRSGGCGGCRPTTAVILLFRDDPHSMIFYFPHPPPPPFPSICALCRQCRVSISDHHHHHVSRLEEEEEAAAILI